MNAKNLTLLIDAILKCYVYVVILLYLHYSVMLMIYILNIWHIVHFTLFYRSRDSRRCYFIRFTRRGRPILALSEPLKEKGKGFVSFKTLLRNNLACVNHSSAVFHPTATLLQVRQWYWVNYWHFYHEELESFFNKLQIIVLLGIISFDLLSVLSLYPSIHSPMEMLWFG